MRTNLRALSVALVGIGCAAGLSQTGLAATRDAWRGLETEIAASYVQPVGQVAELAVIKHNAEQGDARAQYLLGRKYENGVSGPENYAKAARWYRRAAEQEFAPAQYSLGRLYAAGDGVRPDYAEALRWFRRAAALEYALAQNRIGVMYEKGLGVALDAVEAYKWYSLAAAADRNVFALANRARLARRLTSEQIADGERRAELARTQFSLRP